jgi:predicted nucleotidyltransferase
MFTEYIDTWKKKDIAIHEKAHYLQKELWGKFPEVSKKLKSLGAGEVIVFGSLIEGDFRVGSDIDIATKGLPETKYLDAIIAVEKIIASIGISFEAHRERVWVKMSHKLPVE